MYGKPEEKNYHDISTTLIECQNLNLRQDNKRLTRKTISLLQKSINGYN
ncbi:MAG: IS1 family transposase [Methanobrevibacter sp.]|nr:IS1 family transposase [Candidatus Methanovirga australis]